MKGSNVGHYSNSLGSKVPNNEPLPNNASKRWPPTEPSTKKPAVRPDSCFKTNHNVERAHELRVRSGEINDPFVLSAALLSALSAL